MSCASLFAQSIRIPVAVHVVYHNSTENFSDALIQSYIADVNKGFRKQMLPAFTPRPIFDSLWADTDIELCIATDASNKPIITHTPTSVYFQNLDIENIKHTATGGKDPLPTSQYLNIWVAPINGSSALLGNAVNNNVYANALATEGIVINSAHYTYFVTTLIHETGHFAGLLHTFDNAAELVDDTPYEGTGGHQPLNIFSTVCAPEYLDSNTSVQEAPYWGTTNPPDMIENFMGYSRPCQFMFTKGQKARMHTMLQTHYPGLLNANCLTTAMANIPKEEDPVIVYPVPSNGIIKLRGNHITQTETYYLFNSTRSLVSKGHLESGVAISLHLTPGIYYVKVKSVTKKVVVY